MQLIDLYTPLHAASQTAARGYTPYEQDPALKPLLPLLRSWGMDIESTRAWLQSPEAQTRAPVARAIIQQAPTVIAQVQKAFGHELPGTVLLAPSYAEFDGFARYDRGRHTVLLGIDFPDADLDYLRALIAHELSHVYRDHAPAVWSHLAKPLTQVTRAEYLDAGTAQEHLVSEGLATLFSQVLYPEIPAAVHHYYEPDEWQWCETHAEQIHQSIRECLRKDGNVWSYYSESRVAPGSPSRTHYYWAAKQLAARLQNAGADSLKTIVELHQQPTDFFTEFLGA